MTRTDFLENVTTWDELLGFCGDYGCSCCDWIYNEYERDAEVSADIGEYGRDFSWQELRSLLDEIPTGYDYYRRDTAFNWVGMDDYDFTSYKGDVLEWADDSGVWDSEEEAEEEFEDEFFSMEDDELFSEEDDELFSDEPIEDEDFSVKDLISMCSVAFATIQNDQMRKIQEDKKIFDEFVVDINIPKVLR